MYHAKNKIIKVSLSIYLIIKFYVIYNKKYRKHACQNHSCIVFYCKHYLSNNH